MTFPNILRCTLDSFDVFLYSKKTKRVTSVFLLIFIFVRFYFFESFRFFDTRANLFIYSHKILSDGDFRTSARADQIACIALSTHNP